MTGDFRLVLPAIFGWVAVGAGVGNPSLLPVAAVSLWGAACAAIAIAMTVARFRSTLAAVAVLAAIAGLLLSSAAVLSVERSPSVLRNAAQHHRSVDLVVTLDVDSRSPATRHRTPVTITEATAGASSVRGTAIPALLFGEPPPGGLGTSVAVAGTVSIADPGDRVAFLVFARGNPTVTAGPPWYLDWANELRRRFQEAAASLPGEGGALLPGLAIGDTSAVSSTLDSAMKATSLSHLTAVSGANCAVVVGLVMALLGALGAPRLARLTVSCVVLAGFVILVTPSASVLRAAVMAAILLGSLASGRPSRGIAVLCVAVIVLLTADPWMSRDFGFILSVLATAGLLVVAGPLARSLSRWLPLPVAVIVSIPLAAQLACQPVLLLLNPTIPLYGVIANMLSEPAAPLATVLGLIGCVCLPILEPIGQLCTYLAWLPATWIAAVAQFFATAPGSQAPWLPGIPGVLVLAAITALMLVVLLRPKSRGNRIMSGALALFVACYAGAVIGAHVGRLNAWPADWQFAACDIGQGDAVLVRSEGKVALVDTGPSPELLEACLQDLGIRHIDLLILSHYDLDHVGGTSAVVGIVDRAIVGPVSDSSDTALRSSLSRSGAVVNEVARGDGGMLGELRWEVLWPPARLGTIEPGNAASVTVRFDGVGECKRGCLSAMFLGDLGEESQSRMLGAVRPGHVDVVKVAHHGSRDQCERLYQRLSARVGIISVGEGNRYGHPTNELLRILRGTGTLIARTDLEGAILISAVPNGGIRVWTLHPPGRDVGAH